MSRCWTSRTARPPRSSQATSTWTILCSPARTPTPGPCSTRPCIPRTCGWRGGYGGTRFVEDDLAGDPEAGALASNGQGPPSITDRLRSTADGAQAAAGLIGAGAAGLAAAQAFRSQLPQDAAEYVCLNVLPRPGPAQPPPQIIGRRSDVERLLDGGRGSGGGRGGRCCRGRGRSLWLPERPGRRRPPRARLLERWLAQQESAQLQRLGWPLGLQAAQPTARAPSRAARTRPCRTSGPPTA